MDWGQGLAFSQNGDGLLLGFLVEGLLPLFCDVVCGTLPPLLKTTIVGCFSRKTFLAEFRGCSVRRRRYPRRRDVVVHEGTLVRRAKG